MNKEKIIDKLCEVGNINPASCGWWGTSICILENKRCVDIELD
jgi:hypothetical protein|nr:MAG TPA: hypothetical protein [Caudoviricetes sp.]